MRIKKGDYVQVMTGADVGKRGKVLRIFPKKNKIVVEGINYIYKHMKKSQQNPQGGRIQKEASIAVSNVKLYCPHCQSPTKSKQLIEKEGSGEDAKITKVRVCHCSKRI